MSSAINSQTTTIGVAWVLGRLINYSVYGILLVYQYYRRKKGERERGRSRERERDENEG